ncbi:S8 family peptidase [Bacillaceae bacterium S4-13-58]
MLLKRGSVTLTISMLSIILFGCGAGTIEKGVDETEENKAIVELEDGQNISEIEKNLGDVKITSLKGGRYIISSNDSEEELGQKLSSMKGIRRIQKPRNIGVIRPITKIKVGKDFIIDELSPTNDIEANDPGAKSQWAVSYTNSNHVWPLVQQKETVYVAVVDTGVDYKHPDLKNRVALGKGYDFINDDSDPMDDNGHGTHVSGIIAAEMNNGEGIVGVAGTLDVSIIPIKVLDAEGQGQSDIVAKGIEYAVDQGANIINLSLGSPGEDIDIANAIRYAIENGVLVVAAAGNDNQNSDSYTPAGMDNVYTVGAINPLKTKARFSNYGNSVEVAAPGVKILSSVLGNQYEAWDGTSMAAPVVSGVASIMLAQNPDMNIAELASILNESAEDILEDGKDLKSGYGLPNAETAWILLTGEEVPTSDEEVSFSSLQKAIEGASKLKIRQNDVNSLMISSNNSESESERRSKLSDFKDKGSKYKEEDEEQIEEWKKEFKENQGINKQYMQEIYEDLATLKPLLEQLQDGYVQGTLELTPEDLYQIQQEIEKLESYQEYVKTRSEELQKMWDEMAQLFSEGNYEEAKVMFPDILQMQKALTRNLELLLNEINELTKLVEELVIE